MKDVLKPRIHSSCLLTYRLQFGRLCCSSPHTTHLGLQSLLDLPAMPFTMVFFVTRKPGLSPEEFKNYYETEHQPLGKRLAGDLWPESHTRHYIARNPGSGHEPNAPWILAGNSSDFDWDAMVRLDFKNEGHFKGFSSLVAREGLAKVVAEDSEKFMDTSKTRAVIIGEICTGP